jgi:hypothetical protein
MRLPLLLWGTDPRLSFHPDGKRTLSCVDLRPRPATLLEREKREAKFRQENWLPPARTESGKATERRGVRYPTGRSKMDDYLRWR